MRNALPVTSCDLRSNPGDVLHFPAAGAPPSPIGWERAGVRVRAAVAYPTVSAIHAESASAGAPKQARQSYLVNRKWLRCFKSMLALPFVWLVSANLALAQQRFPPPDFESGHRLPLTATPAARAQLLQYGDVAVLALCLGLASWLVFQKRSRKALVALSLFSLLYFGFWRKGCVCSIGSLQNVSLALADTGYAVPLSVVLFFALPLVFALFSGRTFCAAVCPHGALQDLVLLKPITVPAWLEQGLSVLPFVYLGLGVLFAATGSMFVICQYDPFVPLFRMSGRSVMVAAGSALLLLGVFVGRPYCRFL